MDKKITITTSVALLLIAAVISPGCTSAPAAETDTLYQVSAIELLLAGDYDGTVTIGELKEHGDLGLGTIDHLDGELVVVDGEFYTVRSDGSILKLNDDMTVPSADVTFFETDISVPLENIGNVSMLEKELEKHLPSENVIYAIRIDGTFPYVKTRAVPRQDPPYPPLIEVVKNQSVFEFEDIEGTLVGFWSPSYVSGLNVPGYHMHFISADRTKGGHLLDIRIDEADIKLDTTDRYTIDLPENSIYMAGSSEGDLAAVEK